MTLFELNCRLVVEYFIRLMMLLLWLWSVYIRIAAHMSGPISFCSDSLDFGLDTAWALV
jgi:hypothetical protein